jgi:hypothetical protein
MVSLPGCGDHGRRGGRSEWDILSPNEPATPVGLQCRRVLFVNSFWDFFWFMVLSFFFIAYLMVMFQIVVDIFRNRESSGWVKALWLMGLIFFPVLIMIVYLISQGHGMADRQMSHAQAAQASTNEYIRSVAASGSSAADQIAQAKSLLDSGAISAEEYEALKAKALSA